MQPFFIDQDIRKASTPPAEFYSEEKWFNACRDKIFKNSWLYAAHTSDLGESGKCFPVNLLEGFLDEPLLFTRDKDDRIYCLSNVCTHRGNLLVQGACTAQNLRCNYHGRRFGLNGKFQFMPEFEGVENFPSEKDNLAEIAYDHWQKFLFANINPKVAFGVVFLDMMKRMSFLPVDQFKFAPELSRDYLVKANWALYCENYLEGFHIPFVHPSLHAQLDYSGYQTELYRWSSLQLGLSRGGEIVFDLPESSPDYGKNVAAYYWWIFPNMMFNFYPWGLSLNIVRPLGTELTRVSFLSYVWDESRIGRGAGADLDKVEREDEAVVEAVQRGMHSSFYQSGRYSPSREQGTHHFHRLLSEMLNS